VGQDVQMLTVRPVDMAQMVSPGSPFNPNSTFAANTTQTQLGGSGTPPVALHAVQTGEDVMEEPAVKKQRIDAIPVGVPVTSELN